jgi:hypothetical protein
MSDQLLNESTFIFRVNSQCEIKSANVECRYYQAGW